MDDPDTSTNVDRPHLISGVNASVWPDMKWQRAIVHLSDLQQRFLQWSSSGPYSTKSQLRPDGRTIDSYLHVVSPPPLQEWSLVVGDFLHNLRSSLDAIAWELATFNGAVPKRPKSVQFPIASNEDGWNSALKAWVGDLPQPFIDRLSLLQPFRYSEGNVTALEVLHALDIDDKHKSALVVTMSQEGVELRGGFQLLDPEADADVQISLPTNGRLVDGGLLLTTVVASRIDPDLARFAPTIVPLLLIDVEGGLQQVPGLGNNLVTEVRRYIDIIRMGLADDDLDWNPVDVVGT